MNTPRVTLRQKLSSLMAKASLLGLAVSALALTLVSSYLGREASERNLNTLAEVIADNSRAALSFGDQEAAEKILSALHAKRDITLACLYMPPATVTSNATAFAGWPAANATQCAESYEPSPNRLGANLMRVRQPVTLDGETLGWLTLSQDLKPLLKEVLQQVLISLLVVGVAFLLTFGIALRAQTAMVSPLLALASLARKVRLTADYKLRAPVAGNDEVGQLTQDFNGMLEKIDASDAEVRAARDALSDEVQMKSAANRELESTLTKLTETQQQLVQSEKMASLGALVAGVAHEINTPVGVSVTAASTLHSKATELKRKHLSAQMRRSDLEDFMAVTEDATRILLNNLQRAAELIQSFKRVAVDQSSDERRRFELGGYLNEVLVSLGPQLRNVSVKVLCAEPIVCDTYPGVLAQVLTNLATNSVTHGFDDGRHGEISVQAQVLGEQVQLRYQDNGKGVQAEHLPLIFDPFFTTKRGAGGSGLGMHIVFNLVNQRLGGTILAQSRPGEGLRLDLSFPLSAPSVTHSGGTPR